MKLRRLVVITLVCAGIIAASLVYSRGLRYLPFVFEPEPVSTELSIAGVSMQGTGVYVQPNAGDVVSFRAFVPEPAISVIGAGKFQLKIGNVHPDARLQTQVKVKEKIHGLQRLISGTSTGNTTLTWQLPDPLNYRFTAIGDSGGGSELRWILKRSQELGAAFLLHLGDINYVATDFADAERAFNNASIPTFAAIGNHDFYEQGKTVYPIFLDAIGPLNSTFVLGGIRFVNLDTAASIFPLTAGARNTLLTELRQKGWTGIRETIVFTHKPLRDPRNVDADDSRYEHAVSGNESVWLRKRLLDLGFNTLLAGHVHVNAEFDDDGLRTFVSGEGLAHADLIVGKPIAKILVGEVQPDQPVRFHWEALNMPKSAHCNPRGLKVFIAMEKLDELRKAGEICKQNPVAK